MAKKESQIAFDMKISPSDLKKAVNLSNYKKELNIFDVKSHEREIR